MGDLPDGITAFSINQSCNSEEKKNAIYNLKGRKLKFISLLGNCNIRKSCCLLWQFVEISYFQGLFSHDIVFKLFWQCSCFGRMKDFELWADLQFNLERNQCSPPGMIRSWALVWVVCFAAPALCGDLLKEFQFLRPCCRYGPRAWLCVQGWSRPCGAKRLADTYFILYTALIPFSLACFASLLKRLLWIVPAY